MKVKWMSWIPGGALAVLAVGAVLVIAMVSGAHAKNLIKVEFTDEFPHLDDCDLVNSTDAGASNRYLQLEIGRIWELSNEACVMEGECDELEEVTVSVLNETEMVDGVMTRVVEERERVEGELEEVSRNFLVECLGTGDIYYFGEDVEDGDGNPLPDGWRAGMNDARPGILFPGGEFLIGARYFQEVAPGVALDRAENAEAGLEVSVEAGDFSDCVLVLDTNALEDPKGIQPGDEKVYCLDIGIVMDEDLELISLTTP